MSINPLKTMLSFVSYVFQDEEYVINQLGFPVVVTGLMGSCNYFVSFVARATPWGSG